MLGLMRPLIRNRCLVYDKYYRTASTRARCPIRKAISAPVTRISTRCGKRPSGSEYRQ
jgi:hypothetical protein